MTLDYYKTLQVNRTASLEDIQKAYRHLALKVRRARPVFQVFEENEFLKNINSAILIKIQILMLLLNSKILLNLLQFYRIVCFFL